MPWGRSPRHLNSIVALLPVLRNFRLVAGSIEQPRDLEHVARIEPSLSGLAGGWRLDALRKL